jgi:hypothetical protein
MGGIIVESNGLAQRRFDPSEHCQHHRNSLGGSPFQAILKELGKDVQIRFS